MKKLFMVISLFIYITISMSGCVKKEPVKEVKDSGISKEDFQEITKTNTEIQNIQADIRNILTDIQNTQKAILAKLSELDKKSAAPVPSAQQGRPSIDFNKVYNLPVVHSPIKGSKNAPVTIVEFSDFQCPYCAQLQATLTDVLNAYPKEVKLVFKHYPLPFHQFAMMAAKASEAAREQGKFWEMHDLIFQNFSKLSEQALKDFAQQIGLNVEKFSADFASNKYDQQIQQDMMLARSSDVAGTPTLFINGKRMQQRSFNDFKQTIDNILKK
jgi:protein-disulfide isomerase